MTKSKVALCLPDKKNENILNISFSLKATSLSLSNSVIIRLFIPRGILAAIYNFLMEMVYLDDNNLSELSTDLLPWDKLEVLGMTGNSWLCNCDLANIVTKQGAGSKFRPGEIPYCAAPMRMSGAFITNITMSYCPAFDTTFARKKGFSFSSLKPKHILWSVLGVASIVGIGMICGLLVNVVKAFYKKNIRTQPIHYININDDTSFA